VIGRADDDAAASACRRTRLTFICTFGSARPIAAEFAVLARNRQAPFQSIVTIKLPAGHDSIPFAASGIKAWALIRIVIHTLTIHAGHRLITCFELAPHCAPHDFSARPETNAITS